MASTIDRQPELAYVPPPFVFEEHALTVIRDRSPSSIGKVFGKHYDIFGSVSERR
jgi:hypothetical protein